MTIDAYITIAILALTFGLLIRTKLPPVLIFLGALTLTITFRLAPLKESLKGFSNPGVLTIGALFMVAAGMYSTGAIGMITDKLIGRPKTLLGAQLRILPMVSVGSAFLNNTPLVAMMIPVIRDLSKTCRLAATRLYIPLSFSSILGGICTLIGTSTNLVISGMIIDAMAKAGPDAPAMREIRMFDTAWVGVPAVLLASGLMLLTGCMTLGAAGRSVEFKTLVVIASAIGLEAAVTNSGLSGAIANVLTAIGGDNPQIALAVVFLGCILMDTLTTNVASAALMFPIALAMAGELGVNFMPFAIILMIGSSCSFISPMGYAANLMVYEPGGYKFTDYAKVGIPLSILVGIVTVLLAPVFFKL